MSLKQLQSVKHEKRTLGGQSLSVVVVRPLNKPASVPKGIKSLLSGMRLTLNYILHPSKIVTRQYPENRATLKFPPRYRAMLEMPHDENGWHRCTACRMCEKACPNNSITIVSRKGPVSGKMELDRHVWRMDSCIFCNNCVLACPFDALAMTHQFENAVHDRRLLIFNLNRYAGPPASVLATTPAENRAAMIEPRGRYHGPTPMNGATLPVIKPVVIATAAMSAQGGHTHNATSHYESST
jgi:NADH-quinone oxidoreductase subunit I